MGELARKPGAPTFADSPMELLTQPSRGFSWVDHHLLPISGAACGFGIGPLSNLLLKRPWYAGIHVPILMGAAGYYLSVGLNNWMLEKRKEDDEVLKHYISLHPDDFPPYERQRFKDVFLPWHPIR